jgi:DUF1680 family protein
MRHVEIERQKWFGCACCPPNLARLAASLGSYIHSVREGALYTHLFIGGEAKLRLSGADVTVKIETKYPWEEKVDIGFALEGKAKFSYGFRLPGWCKKYEVKLNGADTVYKVEDGYAVIEREWSEGDKLSVVFDMPVSFVRANPLVRDNIGKTAVMRGPVVYCMEEADNGPGLWRIHAGTPGDIRVSYEKDLLEGVASISFTGKRERDWAGDVLYQDAGTVLEDKKLFLIPYYAWANRKAGEMTVWMKV